MSYIRKSIPRAAGSPGAGLKVRDTVVLYNIDDILYCPPPDDKGVVIEEDLVMKPNRYGIEVYMTPGSAEQTSPVEGETDAKGFKPSLKFRHPGNEQEIREFKANELNSKFIGVVRHCNGKPADMIGSLCNPCTISPSYTGNNESSVNEFTLEQVSAGDDMYIYKGNIPVETVEILQETGGEGHTVTVDVPSGSRAKYSEDNMQIRDLRGGKAGDTITILGGCASAASASILDHGDLSVGGGNILLDGGTVFRLTEGSQITLRAYCFDSGAPEDLVWIEQSRYEYK